MVYCYFWTFRLSVAKPNLPKIDLGLFFSHWAIGKMRIPYILYVVCAFSKNDTFSAIFKNSSVLTFFQIWIPGMPGMTGMPGIPEIPEIPGMLHTRHIPNILDMHGICLVYVWYAAYQEFQEFQAYQSYQTYQAYQTVKMSKWRNSQKMPKMCHFWKIMVLHIPRTKCTECAFSRLLIPGTQHTRHIPDIYYAC